MNADTPPAAVALTFTSVPWCHDGLYVWSYAEEEEIHRREVSLTPDHYAALTLFLRHYFTASALCGIGDTCRRLGDQILSITPNATLEKCWGQALAGTMYVNETARNFAQSCFFGQLAEGIPDNPTLSLAPYEAWALHQTYEFFCQDIVPWFLINDGYPFCDAAALLEEIRLLEALFIEWDWLPQPISGYLRIVYSPASELLR